MGSMSFQLILLLQLSFMYFSKLVCILHKKETGISYRYEVEKIVEWKIRLSGYELD
jgi:hypothetical protein